MQEEVEAEKVESSMLSQLHVSSVHGCVSQCANIFDAAAAACGG